jgi:hypothetical protein
MAKHVDSILTSTDMTELIVLGKVRDRDPSVRDSLIIAAGKEKIHTVVMPCFTQFELLSLNYLLETLFNYHAGYLAVVLLMSEDQQKDRDFCRLVSSICQTSTGKAMVIATNRAYGQLEIVVNSTRPFSIEGKMVITNSRDMNFLKRCAKESLFTFSTGYRKPFGSRRLVNLEHTEERKQYGFLRVAEASCGAKSL